MTAPGRLAIVVNPSKFDDVDAVIAQLDAACASAGWSAPAWFRTTAEEPGRAQARQAVAEGATLVCSLGGDGTVRAVASALVGTDVPLGLLPGGTGNLLARNLAVPFTDLDAALGVALTGADRRIDVGEVTFDDGQADVFLVMAGVGLDAETMANTDERLKARVGWLAYVATGAQSLFSRGFRVRATADGHPARSRHARAVVVGNCGELTAGAQLMADALVDDGLLDALIVSPRGVFGWAAVLANVVSRHRLGHRSVQRIQAAGVEVLLGTDVEGELDGDPVGPVRAMRCEVRPRSLSVRVPAAEGWSGGGAVA